MDMGKGGYGGGGGGGVVALTNGSIPGFPGYETQLRYPCLSSVIIMNW